MRRVVAKKHFFCILWSQFRICASWRLTCRDYLLPFHDTVLKLAGMQEFVTVLSAKYLCPELLMSLLILYNIELLIQYWRNDSAHWTFRYLKHEQRQKTRKVGVSAQTPSAHRKSKNRAFRRKLDLVNRFSCSKLATCLTMQRSTL